jgi:hypothetical protein
MFSFNQKQVYPTEAGSLLVQLYEEISSTDRDVVRLISFFNDWSARFHDRQSVDYHVLHSIYQHTIPSQEKERGKQCLSIAHSWAIDGMNVVSSVRNAVYQIVNGIEAIFSTMNQAEDEQNKAWQQEKQVARNACQRWDRCVLAMMGLVQAIAGVIEKWEVYDPGDRYQKEYATINEDGSITAIRKMQTLEREDTGPMYDDGPIVLAICYWIGMKAELCYLANGCSSEKLTISDEPLLNPVLSSMSRQAAVVSAKAAIFRAYEALIRAMIFSLDMYKWRCKWTGIYHPSGKSLTLGDLMQTKNVCFNWKQALSAMNPIAQQVVEAIDILLSIVEQTMEKTSENDQLKRAKVFAYDLCWSGQDKLTWKVRRLAEALLVAECKQISTVQQSELIDKESTPEQEQFVKQEIKDLQMVVEIAEPLVEIFPGDEYNHHPFEDYRSLIWRLARVSAVLLNLDEKILKTVPENMARRVREEVRKKMPKKTPEKILKTVPENMAEKVCEPIRKKVLQKIPEKMLEKVPENMTERVREPIRKKVPQNIPSAPFVTIARSSLAFYPDWF